MFIVFNKYIGFKVIPAEQNSINKTLVVGGGGSKLAHFMLSLKRSEQTANILFLFKLAFLPHSFRPTCQPCVKLNACFIVFTCNKTETSDKAWNAGNQYKSEITVDARTAGGT